MAIEPFIVSVSVLKPACACIWCDPDHAAHRKGSALSGVLRDQKCELGDRSLIDSGEIRMVATRTFPSRPGKVWMTRPNGQWVVTKVSSLITTTLLG